VNSSLNIQQRLALAKFLTEGIAKTRSDVMVPASRDEMPSGARMPAMFGGKLAAWVNMPQPTQKAAYVSDKRKLLAWVKENYPAKVQPTVDVEVTPELIEHLREHFPAALKTGEAIDEYLVSDLCAAMKDPGYYVSAAGEKLTDIPGITLPEAGDPTPTVTLTDDAGEAIGAAWRNGDVPVAELLALPAGGEPDAA
jgi:hypothetical protein